MPDARTNPGNTEGGTVEGNLEFMNFDTESLHSLWFANKALFFFWQNLVYGLEKFL